MRGLRRTQSAQGSVCEILLEIASNADCEMRIAELGKCGFRVGLCPAGATARRFVSVQRRVLGPN
jgi:hypothetical protein